MLREEDVEFIKENRKQIMRNRLETVTVYFEGDSDDEDPYTGEKQGNKYDKEDVEVRWQESLQANNPKGFQDVINEDGESVIEGDASVTFPEDIDVYSIEEIVHNDIKYEVTNIDARGLGGINRYECIVKRVK